MNTSEQIVRQQRFSLLELLDRLLDKGVVVKGEVVLAVADIDLVYLNLELLLSSVKTLVAAEGKGSTSRAQLPSPPPEVPPSPEPARENRHGALALIPEAHAGPSVSNREEPGARVLSSAIDEQLHQLLTPRAEIDPANVEKGLARLVLTLVDLLRKLMEKQAIRRVEAGQLYDGEIERVGNAFFLLDERMEQLKQTFDLKDEDLNIDLGPLGELI